MKELDILFGKIKAMKEILKSVDVKLEVKIFTFDGEVDIIIDSKYIDKLYSRAIELYIDEYTDIGTKFHELQSIHNEMFNIIKKLIKGGK